MKLFIAAILATSSILSPRGALAALTVDEVVTNVGIVTSVSGNINDLLGGLTTSTSPSQVRTMGQTVVANFNTIISDLGGDVTAMQATLPFGDADALLIVQALKEFVAIHQALLSTVISKHGIFAQFGVTAPIAAVLRSLEASIDSFAFAMIDMIPTQAPSVQTDKNSLDSSVGNTITLYEQICIPSVLYPTLCPFVPVYKMVPTSAERQTVLCIEHIHICVYMLPQCLFHLYCTLHKFSRGFASYFFSNIPNVFTSPSRLISIQAFPQISDDVSMIECGCLGDEQRSALAP
ncbi:hypothetical protein B0H10DRAFT_1913109 [Mycena sp. CBHHK59/15]|nr:hypothetical protein B0H10DRAFT_1913109 [Mycena sp. CBHHK59/15]